MTGDIHLAVVSESEHESDNSSHYFIIFVLCMSFGLDGCSEDDQAQRLESRREYCRMRQ